MLSREMQSSTEVAGKLFLGHSDIASYVLEIQPKTESVMMLGLRDMT